MSSKGVDFFVEQYYVYNRRFLTILGLWPYQERSKQRRNALVASILLTLGVIEQIYELLQLEMEVEAIAQLVETMLPCICCASVYCNLLHNFTIIKTIFTRIANDYDKLTDDDEVVVINKYAYQSKIWSLMIACTCYLYITRLIFPSWLHFVLYVLGFIDDQHFILPTNIEYLLTNKIRYFIALPVETLIIIMVCAVGVAYYSMFILFIQHTCVLFNIATIRIDQHFKNNERKFCRTVSITKHHKEYDWIVTVIKCYNDAIDFVELIKLLCGRTYFFEVLLALIFILVDLIYIFQLLGSMITTSEAIKTCTYVVGNMLTIIAYAYFGQKLMDHSADVYLKCCQIPFYTLSVQTNKMLLLFITRCTKQCCLSFQGTLVVSHENLLKVMKTSFSFAMVYYNMR